MNIKGFIKTSLIDYPGRIASTVFTSGCNFFCPFCHNGDLVLNHHEMPIIDPNFVLDHLDKRKNVLDGVCITGGEATMDPGLINFIKSVRDIGLDVKLDTNGYRPDVLEQLIGEGLVDYIAMDVKNTMDKYALTCGLDNVDLKLIKKSIALIKQSNIQHEFRTTIIKEFHTEDDIICIANFLGDCNKYCIQQYKPSDKQIGTNLHAYDDDTLRKLFIKVSNILDNVELRGVEH